MRRLRRVFTGAAANLGGVTAAPSTFTWGSQRNARGSHQLRVPNSFIEAGTTTERMSVASMKTATASPKPIC